MTDSHYLHFMQHPLITAASVMKIIFSMFQFKDENLIVRILQRLNKYDMQTSQESILKEGFKIRRFAVLNVSSILAVNFYLQKQQI